MKNKFYKYLPFFILLLAIGFNSCSSDQVIEEENRQESITENFYLKSEVNYIPLRYQTAEWEAIEYPYQPLDEEIQSVSKLLNGDNEEAYVIYTNKQQIFLEIIDDKMEIIDLNNGINHIVDYQFDNDLGYNRITFPNPEPGNVTEGDCHNGCTLIFVANQVGITAGFLAACAVDGPLPFADALATTAFLSFSLANAASYETCKDDCNKD
ncbi:hypothetical protein [Nonlabens sp. Asnod3-H03]|uniref:hypothetical protein n=1 Tax=Nonlabens sp. Asnod3-H03 TaxID=3160580 RepID=UPI00386BFAC2